MCALGPSSTNKKYSRVSLLSVQLKLTLQEIQLPSHARIAPSSEAALHSVSSQISATGGLATGRGEASMVQGRSLGGRGEQSLGSVVSILNVAVVLISSQLAVRPSRLFAEWFPGALEPAQSRAAQP